MRRSTQGGQSSMLFYLKSLETTAALPHSVCPYTATAGHDDECPGMERAAQTNPLQFSVKSIDWMYERQAVKRQLSTKKR